MSAAGRIKHWREHPVDFVKELFGVEPENWQADVLEAFADPRPEAWRIAMAASAGPGKTTCLAWCGLNFLLCYAEKGEHPKGAAVAVTEDNLRDNLWPELSKWMQRSKIFTEKFKWTKSRIFAVDHPETWWLSARTFSKTADQEEQGRTLSGLHSKYVLALIDESGDIPPSVLRSAEQALGSCKWGKILQAGNTTSLDGMLYHAVATQRDRWKVIRISGDPDDPKRSQRVDIEWAKQQIQDYGRDNPWVMAYVLGQFPPNNLEALISPDVVEAAMRRKLRPDVYDWAQKRLGIDVARQGADRCFDDKTEILTDEGWKLFCDLRGDEKVFSVGVNENKASWERIDHIHRSEWDGKMYLHEKKHLNFCITPNHRMMVRTSPKKSEFCFRPYSELPQEFVIREKNGWSGESPLLKKFLCVKQMPYGGKYTREFVFTMEDWAEFLGWFVSEGCVWKEKRKNGRYKIMIAQNLGLKANKITNLLYRMGVGWRRSSNSFEFSNNEIGQWLEKHCCKYAKNKRVPDEIKNGSERIIQKFLDSFLLGDGSQHKGGKGKTYHSSSKLLIDDLQEMLAKLGRAGSIVVGHEAGSEFYIGKRKVVRKNKTYNLFERGCIGGFNGKNCLKKNVNEIHYKGIVWCVATNKESIYVRRNGIPMWSGNTVIFPRQGLQAFTPVIMRHSAIDKPSVDIANRVIAARLKWSSEREYFDDTVGWAHGAIDVFRAAGYDSAVAVDFGSKAGDPRYANRRSEMWMRMADWLKNGASLPYIPELIKELCAPTYGYQGGKFLLEPKKLIKKRLGYSCDLGDGLALTHAEPDVPKEDRSPENALLGGDKRMLSEYDPYKNMD